MRSYPSFDKKLANNSFAKQIPPLLTVLGALLVTCALATASTSVSFAYTGASQSFVVPINVTTITVDAWGAQGYSASGGGGGLGGYSRGDLAVTPGETITVNVGGAGTVANLADILMGGGFNGGGDGVVWPNGAGQNYAGGGGGASDVRRGSLLVSRLIVAGGGGGGTTNGSIGGAGGGLVGGTATGSTPGTGGTQLVGGNVNAGFGFGGDAISGNTGWVGGGGGGWYGGGASPAHYGGGGGSSYIGGVGVTNGLLLQGVRAGNGAVTLTFDTVPEPSMTMLLALSLFGCMLKRRR